MFALTILHDGTYQLRCAGEGGLATIAFIGHFGSMLVVMLVRARSGHDVGRLDVGSNRRGHADCSIGGPWGS
jgi:hypothetical protein